MANMINQLGIFTESLYAYQNTGSWLMYGNCIGDIYDKEKSSNFSKSLGLASGLFQLSNCIFNHVIAEKCTNPQIALIMRIAGGILSFYIAKKAYSKIKERENSNLIPIFVACLAANQLFKFKYPYPSSDLDDQSFVIQATLVVVTVAKCFF